MKEIWLNYRDENGETKRVTVSDEIFLVGRTPENDLPIPDHRLSREHLRLEFYADRFYASDANSSNGTKLNGATLRAATALRDGDRLNLGGAVEIIVETGANNFNADDFNAERPATIENQFSANEKIAASNIADTNPTANNSAIGKSDSAAIPKAVWLFAPAVGLLVLFSIGGLFWIFSGEKPIAQSDDFPSYTPRPTKSADAFETANDAPPPAQKTVAPNDSKDGNSSATATNNSVAPPKISGETEKVEQNGNSFLRRIAQNDPRAFLTGKQAATVGAKIAQFKNSAALAANLQAIAKNAAQFTTLANSKNLKAQFLAAAALAKIGDQRGEPLAVANQMLPALNDLKITLDNKLADDNLLIVAAYERGAAGKPRSLQTTLEALAKTTSNVSPREIRTIWFLQNAGKITDAEFDFAVRFIAIGAIMQNPKDFNVNAEAVIFD